MNRFFALELGCVAVPGWWMADGGGSRRLLASGQPSVFGERMVGKSRELEVNETNGW